MTPPRRRTLEELAREREEHARRRDRWIATLHPETQRMVNEKRAWLQQAPPYAPSREACAVTRVVLAALRVCEELDEIGAPPVMVDRPELDALRAAVSELRATRGRP